MNFKIQITLMAFISLAACKSQHVGSEMWKSSSLELNMAENIPDQFSQFNLQEEAFYSTLLKAGNTEQTSVRISVPDPEGNYHEFIVWKSLVANQALLEKYPNLQTFQGIHTSTDAIRIRIENSEEGIQAMILGAEQPWYITPVPELADNYIVFYKKDISPDAKSFWEDKVIKAN